jgi:hypothetical protein
MAANAPLSFPGAEPRDLLNTLRWSIGNAVAMQRVVPVNGIGAGLGHERSAMSLVKSHNNNFGSDHTKLRAVVTTAAAALIGTLVGGASVLGIVTAVTQPPPHDIKTDAQPGGAAAPVPPGQAATPPPQTAPVVAERQSTPAAEGPGAVWPDALSARANHGAEPAPAAPAPQHASPPANDRSAVNQSEQYGTGREAYAANSGAATVRDSQPNQISPNSTPAKKRVVATPPSADRAIDETSAGDASVGKTRSDARKSQSQQARAQQRSPDTADRSGDDQGARAYPPQRRVIILPEPDQAANEDRGHRGGGLFDFFGQQHSDGDRWNQDRWNNDWHGSSNWHD